MKWWSKISEGQAIVIAAIIALFGGIVVPSMNTYLQNYVINLNEQTATDNQILVEDIDEPPSTNAIDLNGTRNVIKIDNISTLIGYVVGLLFGIVLAMLIVLKNKRDFMKDFDYVRYFALLASNAYSEGDLDQALAYIDQAKEFEPTSYIPYETLGRMYGRDQEYYKAIDVLSEGINLFDGSHELYSSRGYYYKLISEYSKALTDYDKAITLNVKHAPLYRYRANIYSSLNEYDKAISDFAVAIYLEPKDTYSLESRAKTYEKLDNYEAAILDYSSLINLKSSYADYYYSRALCYLEIKDFAKAEQDLETFILLRPNDSHGYRELSDLHSEQGNFAKALDLISRYMEIEDNFHHFVFYKRGALYMKLGEFQDAIKNFERMLELDDDYSPAKSALEEAKKALEAT